jgi:hypothetical protein
MSIKGGLRRGCHREREKGKVLGGKEIEILHYTFPVKILYFTLSLLKPVYSFPFLLRSWYSSKIRHFQENFSYLS